MTTLAQRLHSLRQHLEAGTLTMDQASQWLSAEAEAAHKLEKDERQARECLMMVNNHNLAGVAIYAKARDIADAHLPKPVDGA